MKRKIISNLFALGAVILTFSICANAQTSGIKTNALTADGEYTIVQSIKLQKNFSKLAGKIELLRDTRLADEFSLMQAKGFAPDLTNEEAKVREIFEKTPVRPAVLRLVAADGTVVDSKALACISAEIKAVKLYASAKQSYEVTCRYANFAPYDGEEATFVEVSEGRLRQLAATDQKTGEEVEMAFVYSHRVGWKFAHAGAGKNRDILSVFTGWEKSATDENDGDFMVVYRRFHFDGTRWICYERRVEEDYWEDEFEFPENSKFPKAR